MALWQYVSERSVRFSSLGWGGFGMLIHGDVFEFFDGPPVVIANLAPADWEQMDDPPDGNCAEVDDIPSMCDEWLTWMTSPTGQELAEHNPNLLVKIVCDGLQSLIDVVAESCPLPECIPLRIGRQTIGEARQILMRLQKATNTAGGKPLGRPDKFSLENPAPASNAKSADAITEQTNASGKALEALLGDESAKILAISRSKKTADDKMRAICGIDKRFLGYDSPKWSELLKVSEGAIRKSTFWKVDRPRAVKAEA